MMETILVLEIDLACGALNLSERICFALNERSGRSYQLHLKMEDGGKILGTNVFHMDNIDDLLYMSLSIYVKKLYLLSTLETSPSAQQIGRPQ